MLSSGTDRSKQSTWFVNLNLHYSHGKISVWINKKVSYEVNSQHQPQPSRTRWIQFNFRFGLVTSVHTINLISDQCIVMVAINSIHWLLWLLIELMIIRRFYFLDLVPWTIDWIRLAIQKENAGWSAQFCRSVIRRNSQAQ